MLFSSLHSQSVQSVRGSEQLQNPETYLFSHIPSRANDLYRSIWLAVLVFWVNTGNWSVVEMPHARINSTQKCPTLLAVR